MPASVTRDQPGVGDTTLVQRGAPLLQAVPVGHGQGEMVEARMVFVEDVPDRPAVVGHDDGEPGDGGTRSGTPGRR